MIKKRIFLIMFWIIYLAIIILISAYLIIIANGYKIHYQTKSIQKTGMIYLKSEPKDVQVYINDKLMANKTPYKLAEVFADRYEAKISKDGYWNWQKTFKVESGKTSANEYIQLFLQEPQKMSVSEEEKKSFASLLDDWPAKGLEIKNISEIWFNDVYITRFSQEIKNVSWHTDLKHIILQIDKEILIMEPDGANVSRLIALESNQKSRFIIIDNGKILFYQDGEQIKKAKIQ